LDPPPPEPLLFPPPLFAVEELESGLPGWRCAVCRLLSTCFIRGFQLLLSSVAACGVCGAADLIGRLRQQFVTLGRLLLNYRRTKLAVSGRLSGCRCLASTEGG
jgi:hypothetical protein